MPEYKIKHITRYSYTTPVIDCTNQILLYPIVDAQLEVKHHELTVSTNPPIEIFIDYFGNRVGVFSVVKPHSELLIESVAQIVTKPIQFPMDVETAQEQWQKLREIKNQVPFIDFLQQENIPDFNEMKETLNAVVDLNEKPLKNALMLSEYVYDNFAYVKGVTNIETPIEDIWKYKAGVCQDFAHILLDMLRMYEIPARYVSGYICPKTEGVRGEGATHAWVEAYIPFYGWLGLDPTNNCIVNDGHVRIAVGRNFNDCTPIKGTYKGSGEHRLEVTVHIENGTPINKAEEKNDKPTYTYEVKNPAVAVNSYRKFQEIQSSNNNSNELMPAIKKTLFNHLS